MLHHAYNDYHFRNGSHRTVAEADQKLFRENALFLIENFITVYVMKADDMKMAKALIEKVTGDNDFMKELVATIKEKINKDDTAVFLIK